MAKKIKNMSLAMNAEMQNHLRVSATKLGCSVSEMIRTLVDNYLPTLLNEESVVTFSIPEAIKNNDAAIEKFRDIFSSMDENSIPVVLRIPKELKGNPEALTAWFNPRVKGIISVLS